MREDNSSSARARDGISLRVRKSAAFSLLEPRLTFRSKNQRRKEICYNSI